MILSADATQLRRGAGPRARDDVSAPIVRNVILRTAVDRPPHADPEREGSALDYRKQGT